MSSARISSRRTTATPAQFDFQSGGHVAQAYRIGRIDAGRHAQPDHGHHHVAGARDVINGPGTRREDFTGPVVFDEHHAVAVESDQGHVCREILAQLPAGQQRRSAVAAIWRPVASSASMRFGLIIVTPR